MPSSVPVPSSAAMLAFEVALPAGCSLCQCQPHLCPVNQISCRGLDLRKLRDNTVEQRDSAYFAADLSDLGFGDLAVLASMPLAVRLRSSTVAFLLPCHFLL